MPSSHAPSIEKYPAPLRIDLEAVLRERKIRIPRPVIKVMQRIVRQDGLNEILRNAFPKAGAAFAESVLRQLDITLTVNGLDRVPPGRHIFASNHPLGGLDGIALIAVLGEKYGDENVSFLVNEMLMSVRPLESVFLPIKKYGAQGRDAAAAINAAYASGRQIMIFPAGLVSRLSDNGEIRDLQWQKGFVAKGIEFHRDIIPVHFHAVNSRRFYRLARCRKKLGIRFNVEQVFLPAEVFRSRGKHFVIEFFPPVSPDALVARHGTPLAAAAALRDSIYTGQASGPDIRLQMQ